MKHYHVGFAGNSMIVAASSIQDAEEVATRSYGTVNTYHVREASKDDIEWVESMGGYGSR